MKKYFLGIDIGTYESKGTLCDASGNLIAVAKRKHSVIMPQPEFAEHGADVWWNDFCEIAQEILLMSGINPVEIAGIGCSAVACGLMAIDENLIPLRNAILYGIDRRSLNEIRELNTLLGEDTILDFCGEKLSAESYGPKILWIKNNEKDIYEKAKYFTISQSYLNLRLTGKNKLDFYSTAFAMPMYDYRAKNWDSRMCKDIVHISKLPSLCNAHEVIGVVTQRAAGETGLAAGTPVVCGTTDAASEALSVGISSPGDTMVMYGSSLFIVHITDRLVIKKNPIWKTPFILPECYSVISGMATAGAITVWLLNVFGLNHKSNTEQNRGDMFDILFSGVEKIPAGSNGLMVLPYFAGERQPINNPLAKGLIFGLMLSHNRDHIVRACLEGIGYGLDQNLEIIKNMGFNIEEITAIGGGTKNPAWMQIMSDITGINHRICKIGSGASFGDAMLAAFGTNEISLAEINGWNETDYIIKPNQENHQYYETQKERFKSLYENNRGMMT